MDNEYLYKLGVDASDLDAAITVTVSIIGELESLLGSKMPRSTAAFVGGLEKVRTTMQGVAAGAQQMNTAVGETVATADRAVAATTRQVAANQALIQSYREAAVLGTSSGVGTSNTANTALLNTQQVTGIGNIAAQQEYAAQASSQRLAAMRAYYTEEAAAAKVTAQTLAQLDAERTQRVEAMYAQFRAEDQAYNQGNAARYGVATGDNVTGLGTTNARNSAALNSGTTARSLSLGAQGTYAEQASSANLAAMRDYYTAQEKTAQGTIALGRAQTDQSSNLPRLRYALYDVSMAFGIYGAALAGVGGAIAKTAVEYQQLFAQVERSSQLKSPQALAQLKTDLIGITEQLPTTFADVTKIATLGNQLGIPATALVNFTKTVTEFSAETNVSVEASATAFGRLGQILKTTDYKQLGDEIAFLGVNAVATESDIIKVAQQIAVTTTAYGLNEKQTLALATAYASLGIKAESARGTTSRAFSDISSAVQQGGTKLEEISRVSNLSGAQFSKLWKTDANAAFTAFVTGLGQSGSNAKSILAELGITAQRDITNISLLGQNVEVLNKANSDAGKSAGYMDKAYQAIARTVQSQLTIAGNKVQSIFNDIAKSGSTPIAGLLKGLNDVLDIIDQITKDPVAAGGLAITVGLVSLTGIALLAIAALASFKANALAIGTAIDQLGIKGTSLSGIFRILVFNQTAVSSAAQKQAAALAELAAAEERVAAGGEALAANQIALAAAQGRVTVATEALTAAQAGAAGSTEALGAAGAGAAAGGLGEAGLLGVLGGPVGIIATLALLVPLLPVINDAFQTWIDKTTGAAVSTDQLTASIRGLSAAHAEQALGQVDSALHTATEVAGESNGGRGNGQRTPGQSGAQLYYNQQTTGSYTSGFDFLGQKQSLGQRAGAEIQTYDQSLAGLAAAKNYAGVAAGLKEYQNALKDSGLKQGQLNSLLTQTASALGVTKGQTLAQALAAKVLADANGGASDKQKALHDSLTNYIADAFGASTKTDALSVSLAGLGKDFVDSGAASASGGSKMTAVIQEIANQAGTTSKTRDELEGLYHALINMGAASPQQLAGLLAVIKSLGGTGDAAGTAVPGIAAFVDAMNKASDAANKTATSNTVAQRTLMNYGSDLGNTFSAAFTYQFGAQDATDKIASGWQKMKDDAAAAAASIKGIRADLLALDATKAQAGYDVKVAQAYGDVIGEAKAKANLAKANDDIAAKNKDLKNAQDASSGALKGNSAAAIANRAALEGQIQNYQGYIVALAQSGASQSKVEAATRTARAEFVRQATQMGLSRKEVEKYATSFDGMGKIVKAIPRNITTKVTANTSAAEKAIADYKASIKGAQAAASKPVHIAAPTLTPKDGALKLGQSVAADIQGGLDSIITPQRQQAILAVLNGNYSGQLPSNIGTPVGIPVSSTPLARVPGSGTANQGRAPQSATPSIIISGGGSSGSLSPSDRMFLAQALSAKPAIQLSASQFGKAIDGANVKAGQRGAG